MSKIHKLVQIAGFTIFSLIPVNGSAAQESVPERLWEDMTATTIGKTTDWSNKVELADINGDGQVDLLFANGGNYDTPGTPVLSRVFINNGPDEMFTDRSDAVFGGAKMLARVIKVRDVNSDGNPDIIVGTPFQTQSRLFLGDGREKFTDVTSTHLPQIASSVGDLELGDVDGDSDLDLILADWGAKSPMSNEGGRTMLWLNDGSGHFSDETASHMPDVLVKFSWELEFVDVDNDYDLDILVSCKRCTGSFLFINDGQGNFTDVSQEKLPQFTNNYEFEAMDLDGDGYLDLVTINDGRRFSEHVFRNNQEGGFEDITRQWWPFGKNNLPFDDNMEVFLDFDSDGDADFLVGSLEGPDRLLINDGAGNLTVAPKVFTTELSSRGTLGIAIADLNGDGRLDVVEAQGEAPGSEDERVYLGTNIKPDSAPPVVSLVEDVKSAQSSQAIQIRARIHDNKSPTMPHDWQAVTLKWGANEQTDETPMIWYGEYLWRGTLSELPAGNLNYQVCATDRAGNEACSPMYSISVS